MDLTDEELLFTKMMHRDYKCPICKRYITVGDLKVGRYTYENEKFYHTRCIERKNNIKRRKENEEKSKQEKKN